MGSYTQAIVGGMLLVVAFFFGRYINQQPKKAESDVAQSEQIVGALNTATPGSANDEQLLQDTEQQSLRERILNQRQAQANAGDSNQEHSTISPAIQNEVDAIPDFSEAVVEPDFSHLTFEGVDHPVQHPPVSAMQSRQPPKKPVNAIAQQAPRNVYKGRFTIRRPAPDLPDDYDETVARRNTALRPHVRSHRQPEFGRQPQPSPKIQSGLAADNPRYRMVPVRENIGKPRLHKPEEFVNYTTVFGDTLHGLSTKFFGTPDRYFDIYLANRKLFESPAEVPVNTEIRIPIAK